MKTLVEMHGGDVTVHSDGPGSGSEFIVRLPLPATVAKGMASAAVPSPGRLRVLIVDDNTDAAEMLSELLSHLGHSTSVAYDGIAALERISAGPPQVALVDIGLPRMSGHELARRIRRERPSGVLKLIAVSGYAQEEDRRRSRESGFDAHLAKPVDINALQRLLAELFKSDLPAE